MRVRARRGAAVGLVLLAAAAAGADSLPDVSAHPPWAESRRDEGAEGYVLYRREMPGSDFAAYRLEAVVDVPAATAAAAFRSNVVDPETSPPNITKTVLDTDPDAVHLYSYIDLPLVSDRDVNTRGRGSFDAKSGVHRFDWQAVEDGRPPVEGVVRLPMSSGSSIFIPLSDGRTKVVYESHVDIGGAIPAWLVDDLMSENVVASLGLLRDRLVREGERAAREGPEGSETAR